MDGMIDGEETGKARGANRLADQAAGGLHRERIRGEPQLLEDEGSDEGRIFCAHRASVRVVSVACRLHRHRRRLAAYRGKRRDLLPLAVFEDGEIVRRETSHGTLLLVAHDDVHDDGSGRGFEPGLRRLLRGNSGGRKDD